MKFAEWVIANHVGKHMPVPRPPKPAATTPHKV
jgi:hypothetical protein